MYRPKLHFTPKAGWMNDPNGLVYENGQYHLFYQHNPASTVWGPMHWGHAVSRDLVHWEHLPIALYPDALGLAFSGSAVCQDGRISAIYTSHGQMEQQSLAVSEDGVHFTPYAGNPVIPNVTHRDFRDPKVFEDPAGGWGLVLAAGDRAMFYHSEDLIHWDKTGEFGPVAAFDRHVWECPNIVQIDGRWVFMISLGNIGESDMKDGYYWIGRWDGRTFTADTEPEMMDFCRDDYAGVTYYGAPQPTLIAWASNWAYANQVPTGETDGFRSQMTFARALSLVETPAGTKLAAKPLGGMEPAAHVCQDGPFAITFSNGEETFHIGVDADNCVYMDRTGLKKAAWSEHFSKEAYSFCRVPRFYKDRPCDLTLYLDETVAEVYADGGTRVGTMLLYPEKALKISMPLG